MSGTRNRIQEEFLGEIRKDNQRWFDLYKAKNKNYHSQIRRFLRYTKHNEKSLDLITVDDIREFADMLENLEKPYKRSGFNNFIFGVSELAKFLRDEIGEPFPEEFLTNITAKEMGIIKENEGTDSYGKALTQNQLWGIRKYNQIQETRVEEYFFEILFQLGVTIEDLDSCKPKYQNSSEKWFGFNKDPKKNLTYNKKIETVIERLSAEDKKEINNAVVDNNEITKYLKRVTTFLKKEINYTGKNINKDHIKKSHEVYILPCFNCGGKLENLADNWLLVHTESDENFRLVCVECKGEDDEYQNS